MRSSNGAHGSLETFIAPLDIKRAQVRCVDGGINRCTVVRYIQSDLSRARGSINENHTPSYKNTAGRVINKENSSSKNRTRTMRTKAVLFFPRTACTAYGKFSCALYVRINGVPACRYATVENAQSCDRTACAILSKTDFSPVLF